jgi:hypothetical protein
LQPLERGHRLVEPVVDLGRDRVELVEDGREQPVERERAQLGEDVVVDRER